MALVTKNFSDIITFTRASTATYFNSSGVLTSAAVDQPRFDYNPSTLAAPGLLIEEARTNSIRNNTMQGAVAGTPGTLPTNWAVVNTSGLSTSVIGFGVEAGVSYLDVNVSGTTTNTTYTLSPELGGTIAASNGQTWTASLFLRVVGGSTANIAFTELGWSEQNSVPSFLAFNVGVISIPTSGSLATNRVVRTGTNGQATTAFIRPALNLGLTSIGVAIDITLRIGLPQLELGSFVTSTIPTTTTALTRSADVASVNTLSPWWNSAGGTLYAESFRTTIAVVSTFPSYAEFDNGTLNRYGVYNALTAGANEYRSFVQDAGVSQADIGGAASRVAAGTVVKQAAAFAANDFALSVNGSSVFTDTAGTLPSSTNRLSIGSSYISANFANAWIRRITYYPRRLSNAELQAITA